MPSQQDIDYGKLGAKYGKRGGRPSSKGELLGMATVEYNEIVAFLNSPQSSPVIKKPSLGTGFSISNKFIFIEKYTQFCFSISFTTFGIFGIRKIKKKNRVENGRNLIDF